MTNTDPEMCRRIADKLAGHTSFFDPMAQWWTAERCGDVPVKNQEIARLRRLEQVVKDVLAQKADDVCWRDVYTEMAGLVGVELDPGLLPRGQFLHNCGHFYDCLAKGERYVTPDPFPWTPCDTLPVVGQKIEVRIVYSDSRSLVGTFCDECRDHPRGYGLRRDDTQMIESWDWFTQWRPM